MPYKIIDAEGVIRFHTDKELIKEREIAEDYVRASTEQSQSMFPNWYPMTIVEVSGE